MLHIKNGIVIDPKNGIIGEKMDIFIKDGKIVEEVEVNGCKTIDANGKLVVAGGIDLHAHIAGGKINTGRAMRPEEMRHVRQKTGKFRAAVGRTLLTSPAIGYEYAKMGYTTAIEPATPSIYVIHTHEELDSIPIIDKATLPLFGNWHPVLRYSADKDIEKLKSFVAWVLERTKGYGVKLVNPGGVEAWMYGGNVKSIDDTVPGFGVTPREIITSLIAAVEELKLPHSVHIHCNNLGMPGNYETTMETIKLAKGFENERRQVLHVTHVQFNAYTGSSWRDIGSGAEHIAKLINSMDNVTIDMGQPIFGYATTMTADCPWQFELHKIAKAKWCNRDIELETGAGIVPYVYRPKNPVNSVQWAVGLELGLLVDSEKIAVSTDYPNGGPFTSYPYIVTLLMSRKFREEEMKKAHPYMEKATSLSSIDKEKSLEEVITMTRVTPAKVLGMENKGHLGVGADGDVVIYDIDPLNYSSNDWQTILKAFENPLYTIKSGEIVVKDGELVGETWGRTFWVDARADTTTEIIEADLEEYFNYYTVKCCNYGVKEAWLRNPVRITAG
ncbi:MAG: formylmethanofuran dehydrogenase subunit A [Archaeoglobales archaeon]|nr:MAG: formylmethanofuran dehydrogenase subunit A [Archaeoglobales archaeon]